MTRIALALAAALLAAPAHADGASDRADALFRAACTDALPGFDGATAILKAARLPWRGDVPTGAGFTAGLFGKERLWAELGAQGSPRHCIVHDFGEAPQDLIRSEPDTVGVLSARSVTMRALGEGVRVLGEVTAEGRLFRVVALKSPGLGVSLGAIEIEVAR